MNKTIINNKQIYSPKSKEGFLEFISAEKKILVAINAEKIMNKDENLKTIINENIGYPDGVGAVMALKQKGLRSTKIAGAEFWLDIIKKYENDKSFYILGSTDDVIESTIKKLKVDFQNINILGYQNGFLQSDDIDILEAKLIELKPDFVFIAQGSPRQELLMARLIKKYPALYMGLGGSFDVYCGLKKRAPKIFLKLKLEWFYRLLKEPTRIGRQFVLIKFMFLLLRKKI